MVPCETRRYSGRRDGRASLALFGVYPIYEGYSIVAFLVCCDPTGSEAASSQASWLNQASGADTLQRGYASVHPATPQLFPLARTSRGTRSGRHEERLSRMYSCDKQRSFSPIGRFGIRRENKWNPRARERRQTNVRESFTTNASHGSTSPLLDAKYRVYARG